MPWMVGGAILGGALISSKAAGDAASAQGRAADSATAEQRRQFDLSRSDQAPYRAAGGAATNRLIQGLGLGGPAFVDENDRRFKDIYEGLLDKNEAGHMQQTGISVRDPRASGLQDMLREQARGMYLDRFGGETSGGPDSAFLAKKFTMEDFMNDPVNQAQGNFALDEGRKAIERRAAANGSWDSGAALKALTRYGSDYGNQRAGESYNRFVGDQTNLFNRLASVSGFGQTAANTSATLGANMANNIGANTMQAANARGAAGVASANSINQGIGTGLNFYQNQQFMNRLAPQQASLQTPTWNPYMTGDFPEPSQFMTS